MWLLGDVDGSVLDWILDIGYVKEIDMVYDESVEL